jgi:hypothetical protein
LKFRGPNCTVPILGTSSSTRRIFWERVAWSFTPWDDPAS